MSMVEDKKDAKTAKAGARRETPYPEHLVRETPPYRPGVMRVPVDRFFKQAYHDLEVERIWKKTWQWACREDEIPNVGDYVVYEIAELSFIVVRTAADEIKAYWNSCLHRGRRLCDFNGKRAEEFRCMFHGWAWNIDGTMKDMTCGWDFAGTRDEVTRLPEARTGTWGGFVFINPDPDCESLEDFLGELPDHYEGAGHDFAKRWAQVHVVADIACNWKVAQEAFLEAWHVNFTHPQMVRTPGDRASTGMRWDDFGNWMRNTPQLPTDKYKNPPGYATAAETEQQVVDQRWGFHLNEDPPIKVPEGEKANEVIKNVIREYHRSVLGDAIDDYHDVHMGGGEMVHIWPNMHPWGGFSRLLYRFRPYKSDPNRSLMDVVLMAPWPEDRPRPPPAPPHVLQPGQSIGDAPELGQLARIFQQDLANMPFVQIGLKTSRQGYVILSDHNEAPVRHWHDLYNKAMGFENGDYLAEESNK
ncbi:MAG: aromatic ring-hydroxylating dioxygenase subunit alpha [Caulobacteraceae bacterium]|nr:aromatic ring-hydroxylating dioxygenase subunit alpha [Caulobacteraceae bacterium]